jgi:hypothetical protein
MYRRQVFYFCLFSTFCSLHQQLVNRAPHFFPKQAAKTRTKSNVKEMHRPLNDCDVYGKCHPFPNQELIGDPCEARVAQLRQKKVCQRTDQ